jgi:hypothetical protein
VFAQSGFGGSSVTGEHCFVGKWCRNTMDSDVTCGWLSLNLGDQGSSTLLSLWAGLLHIGPKATCIGTVYTPEVHCLEVCRSSRNF